MCCGLACTSIPCWRALSKRAQAGQWTRAELGDAVASALSTSSEKWQGPAPALRASRTYRVAACAQGCRFGFAVAVAETKSLAR